ncbi:MAG: hypothetical protein WC756_12120 [Taibaiella sp.]|jgi:hypothetical protein
MKRVTALTIKHNFPENIHIQGDQKESGGKWSCSVYLKKGNRIHTLLLTSKFVFEFRQVAENHARTVCESIVNDKNL